MDNGTPTAYRLTEWWFIAVLLTMFACLMASHIGMLWRRVDLCDRYAGLWIEEIQLRLKAAPDGKPLSVLLPPAEICKALANDFNSVANLYLATILAMLSGAGYSAGKASAAHRAEAKRSEPS